MASPNSTFTEMVTTTLRKHYREVTDNVSLNNALYSRMKKKGNIKTEDGGETWSAITGPSAQAAVIANTLAIPAENRVFIGYADGDLYYTEDKGTTWSARSFEGSGAGAVKAIDFWSPLFGAMVHNTAAPVGSIHITVDGGYNWKKLTNPSTNAGLTSLSVVNPSLIWASGLVSGGTAVIYKAFAPTQL